MKKGLFNVILTAIVFVTLEPVSKLIAGQVSPYAITFWRFAIGSLILIPFAVAKIKFVRDVGDAVPYNVLSNLHV